jgi:hypothetical protein
VLPHLVQALDPHQLRLGSRMARLATALAATALTPLGWLKTRPIVREGGESCPDPLAQAGKLGRECSELLAELIDLLMLGKDQSSFTGWSRRIGRF